MGGLTRLDEAVAKIADVGARLDKLSYRLMVRGDTEFREEDHPRASDGKFGAGGSRNLTPNEVEAVTAYTKNSAVNTMLIHGSAKKAKEELVEKFGNERWVRKWVKEMEEGERNLGTYDKIFSSESLDKSDILYRVISSKDPLSSKDLKPGNKVMSDIFMSTSSGTKLAGDFLGRVPGGKMITIRAPKGSKVFNVGEFANKKDKKAEERIIPRGTEFEVEKNDEKGLVLRITGYRAPDE